MLWLCFDDAMLYLNDEIRNIYYEFLASVQFTEQREYYEDCADLVHTRLGSVTARLYADAYFTAEAKSLVSKSYNYESALDGNHFFLFFGLCPSRDNVKNCKLQAEALNICFT